jgi:hypothetical protein
MRQVPVGGVYGCPDYRGRQFWRNDEVGGVVSDCLLGVTSRFMNVVDDRTVDSHNLKPPHSTFDNTARAQIQKLARSESIK